MSVPRGEGGKNVAVAGTPEPLAAVSTPCIEVLITARPGNAGVVAIGYSNAVLATAGAEVGVTLRPGGGATFSVQDVSLLWIDASINGEGVSYCYNLYPTLPR